MIFNVNSKYIRAALNIGYSSFLKSDNTDRYMFVKQGLVLGEGLSLLGNLTGNKGKMLASAPLYCAIRYDIRSTAQSPIDLTKAPLLISDKYYPDTRSTVRLLILDYKGTSLKNMKTKIIRGNLQLENCPNLLDFTDAKNLSKSSIIEVALTSCLSLKTFAGLPAHVNKILLKHCSSINSSYPLKVDKMWIFDIDTVDAILKCTNITCQEVLIFTKTLTQFNQYKPLLAALFNTESIFRIAL